MCSDLDRYVHFNGWYRSWIDLCTACKWVERCQGISLLKERQAAINRHIRWPTTFMAVLAAVFLGLGVLRHYWDIFTHRTVRGISFIFVGIDAAGDLFSLISVCTVPSILCLH